jgi:hypothetical protein
MSAPAAEPDPALVAASGPAAAVVLGNATPAPGQAPSSGIPALAASSPVAPGSRYHDVGIEVWIDGDGRERPFLRRRMIPQPEDLATSGWETVGPGDRIDLVAARALSDPRAFWQLCDANLAFDPVELEQAGRVVRVALPAGFPGSDPTGGTLA